MIPSNYFIKLLPEVSIAALKAKLGKELALWYELRSVNSSGSSEPRDQWGSGRLILDRELLGTMAYFGYSTKTFYRILRSGHGKFWDISQSPQLPQYRVIKLRGQYKVAKYLNLNGIHCYPIRIPASDFRGRKAKTAWLYASFFRAEGTTTKPISRASIEAATGIARRQQQRYDKITIRRVANFAFSDVGAKFVPLYQLVEGKGKSWWKNRRLGNTYYSKGSKANKGMTNRVNEGLRQQSLIGDEARLPRRFFLSAKSLVRSPARDPEAFLLIPTRNRAIKGRLEWCLV